VCVCACAYAGAWVRACLCLYPSMCVGSGARALARACSCVPVALLIQHATPLWLHRIFRHFLINGTNFEKMLRSVKCVFYFYLQLIFGIFLILRRIQRDIIINMKSLNVKYLLFLWDFNETNFLDIISKKGHTSSLIEIRPVGAELFHADKQTDRQTWRI
jgi:hypothetical protein